MIEERRLDSLIRKPIRTTPTEMKEAARALEFEKAAALRDQLMELRALQVVEQIER